MFNEASETLKKYFGNSEGVKINYLGNKIHGERVAAHFNLKSLCLLECPDLFSRFGNEVILIEHFEFDGFKNTKKGSGLRREIAVSDQKILEMQNQMLHQEIQTEYSYERYINNVTKVFLNHYAKINDYKNNMYQKQVITQEDDVKTMFLIEDISPFGCTFLLPDEIVTVNLAQSQEFLDLISSAPNVDYILICSQTIAANQIWLIVRDELAEYYKITIDYANCELKSTSTIQMLSFRITIDQKGLPS